MKTSLFNRTVMALFSLAIFIMGCKQNSREESVTAQKKELTEGSGIENRIGIQIGDIAPNMNYPSPDGQQLSLYSLRGKMVLIDFWAGWCPPCREQNPYLVKTYQTFKEKDYINGHGFTIYSVSLDRSKKEWIKAIEQDNLSWKYHVSDLKGWKSVPAAQYQVMGIPANFLIDGHGVIVAKNLKGDELTKELDKYLK